jgi:hypothetical protein
MKYLKNTSLAFILVLVISLIWIYLPIQLLYRSEIIAGNKFAENLKNYQQKHGKLPAENDWETLAKLNPIKPYKAHYPHLQILDKPHFELIFVRGFDPPYLRYSTKTQKWEYR